MDSLCKSRGPGMIPLAPISKTLWSHAVEASLEYCRVVWDIHGEDRCLLLLVNGDRCLSVNSWAPSDQHLSVVMSSLPQVVMETDGGDSSASADADCDGSGYSMHAGLSRALQCLVESPDPGGSDDCDAPGSGQAPVGPWHGRVLLLCRRGDDTELSSVQHWFSQALEDAIRRNSRSGMVDCDLSVVAIQPAESTESEPVCVGDTTAISRQLRSSISYCRVDQQLFNCITTLVLRHYQLASTIITGIPMKEEQNAGSSANYDVVLLHPRSVMAQHYRSEEICSAGGRTHETVTLRWCAPRSCSIGDQIQPCLTAAPVTPLDVSGRPSCCLVNFLLNGRTVMLEQARRCNTRHTLSHMLFAHGGAIYMHALAVGASRRELEHVPPIGDGVGGRVADYRVLEFVQQLIAKHRLRPGGEAASGAVVKSGSEVAVGCLQRSTRFWPLTAAATAALHLPLVQQLVAQLGEGQLDSGRLAECRRLVMALVAMETRHEPLPASVVVAGVEGRPPTRHEQFNAIWREVEQIVRAYSRESPSHRLVLDCVLECRSGGGGGGGASGGGSGGSVALEQAISALDGATAVADSPASPPPAAKRPRLAPPLFTPSGQTRSLLSAWGAGIDNQVGLRRTEFAGRLTPTFKLYSSMTQNVSND